MSWSSKGTIEDNFKEHGPQNLEQINWGDEDHRRIVAACLVQGVYVRRIDGKKERDQDRAIAPLWWESMRFKMYACSSNFPTSLAMIFEFDRSIAVQHGDLSIEKAPNFVVAIRGAPSTFNLGFKLLLSSNLTGSDRDAQRIFDEVLCITHSSKGEGQCNIWLVGHSIGASIATTVGIMLVERARIFLETFLFNPPYLRLDPITLRHRTVRRVVENFQKLVAKLLHGLMVEASNINSHSTLEKWMPKLYLNPNDYICKGFIEYFENKEHFTGMSTTNLIRVQENGHYLDLNKPLGIGVDYPIYLLPSGRVILNATPNDMVVGDKLTTYQQLDKMIQAHKLSQWWNSYMTLLDQKEFAPKDVSQVSS